ncbi:MAG: DUF819 domain-containing protein [Phycisphaerae bacterium]
METQEATTQALVTDPAGILAILLASLGVIFWISHRPPFDRFFKIVPALVFCYFVPTTLTTLGVIPLESSLYTWIKHHILPTSLLLLIISLDLPGIIRLGPKAGIMVLAGTAGVLIGGPISLMLMQAIDAPLPDDVWKGVAALCGSWIGGGANFNAMGDMVGIRDDLLALMIIPDVFVANIWTGCLFYAAGQQKAFDRWLKADDSAIEDLKKRITEAQLQTQRIATLTDLMVIVAIGFGGSYACIAAAHVMPSINMQISGETVEVIGRTTWTYLLVTTLGIVLSFTPVRSLEGAGASRVGSVLLYVLIASIGAKASFLGVVKAPWLIVLATVWILIHIVILVGVGKLIRAPVFFIALGSQANIGGAASAPVVASAFHPSLATVGVLMAVACYAICSYAGVLEKVVLEWVAGA